METKEELITVYYGSCPRCGVKQRSECEFNVDIICYKCLIIEENNRIMEVFKQTDAFIDTNISAEIIRSVCGNTIVLNSYEYFTFIGKSGAKYDISIIDGDDYDAKIMIEILEQEVKV